MIKVLHIVTALDGGGIENMLFNYYSNMNHKNIVFDFITHTNNGVLEKKFAGLGSKIYHVPFIRKALFKNLKLTKEIIANGNYDAVHSHIGACSAFPMLLSKLLKIKMRITHSHLANRKEPVHRRLILYILQYLIRRNSNYLMACGKDAGVSLFGNKAVESGKVHIINNAIDIAAFTFHNEVRNKIRKELNIENKFVIGNVARFDYQKNHEFLILIFNEIYQKDKKSVLLLAGRGDLEADVRKQVKDLGLSEAVKFLGVRDDVPYLLQAMDVFVLPSRYEGLPVVLVETQAAGLASIASDKITSEVKVTGYLNYIPLEKSPQYWANEVLKCNNGYERRNTSDEIRKSGFDINQEAGKLELIYGS